MSFKNKGLTSFTDDLLGKQDKFQKLKELGNKKSVPFQLKKCREALLKDQKFWEVKQDSELKENKLLAIRRDLTVIDRMESTHSIDPEDKKKLFSIVAKYNL